LKTARPGITRVDSSSEDLIHVRFPEILRSRDFRLLWGGQFVSLLAEQFFLVALPWLVLQLTGDVFAVGTVVAVTAAPRAVFLLLGGALLDRFSPRTVMLYSNLGRMVLVAVLAVLTVSGSVRLWMLYTFALLLGLGYAVYLPAQSAIIPRLLPNDRLRAGNAITQGTFQLSRALGPVLAGVLIAVLGTSKIGTATAPDSSGVGIVFGLEAASFLVSAITLMMIALSPATHEKAVDERRPSIMRSVGGGFTSVWQDKTLRHFFMMIGLVNLALMGPISVGLPVLAATRFHSAGAIAYGAILSGLGLGAVCGVVAGAVLRRPPGRSFPAALLCSSALLGVGLALLGAFSSAAASAAAAFLIGLAEGYLTVEFITWLQMRTSREQLGRMMGILLFASLGQAPLSNVIAGALMGYGVPVVMIFAGGFIVLVAVSAAFSPSVWKMRDAPLLAVRGTGS
jgi:MFS family permease